MPEPNIIKYKYEIYLPDVKANYSTNNKPLVCYYIMLFIAKRIVLSIYTQHTLLYIILYYYCFVIKIYRSLFQI